MKITQNVRDYAAQQTIDSEREDGMQQMSEEYRQQGNSLYQKV